MPFVPHTEQDIAGMLKTLGILSTEELFAEIPASLRAGELRSLPEGKTEMSLMREMHEVSAQDAGVSCFIGAGAYEHHIPAVVWDIASRGEYMTAYTPYQAEASQGTLQLIYEYQTMMCELTAMEVSNASLYDGASALAEAVLMSIRANRKSQSKRVCIPSTVHPHYRSVVKTIVQNQGIEIIELPIDKTGTLTPAQLAKFIGQDIAALIIAQPNFLGQIEDVSALTDWAHSIGALVIGVVNPLALSLLTPPGQWGQKGADIVCGEGQPLGVPLASGGPYFGFMTCRKEFVRQMPGRIVGRTQDMDGKIGFTLTLQAREQHIRRSKATSNICTNQGLLVTAATIYMSLLGAEGLRRVALQSHHATKQLVTLLTKVPGVTAPLPGPFFHEVVMQLPKPATEVLAALANLGIQGGISLAHDYPEWPNAILVCATETKTEEDLQRYQQALIKVLENI